jgi:hypothetical protein|tara:strand:- start:1024 stop:1440 length:417 start_codon:yes stop_codon:yes gene_type:complete
MLSGNTIKLAHELVEEGIVDVELQVQSLRASEVSLFISLFTWMSGLREQLVKRIFFEPGGEDFAITYKGISISKYNFSYIFAYNRSAIQKSVKDFSAKIRDILKFYSSATQDSGEHIIQRWTRDPDYLSALRDLELME